MANGIRTNDPREFYKGPSSKFREGSRVRQTPEEGRRTYRPKRCGNNNKDEDNSPKTLNDKNKYFSSITFFPFFENIFFLSVFLTLPFLFIFFLSFTPFYFSFSFILFHSLAFLSFTLSIQHTHTHTHTHTHIYIYIYIYIYIRGFT